MTKEEIINAIASNKGGMFTVKVERPAKVKVAHKNAGLKVVSTFQLQKADYGRTKAVREAIESGKRNAPELPKWIDPASIEKKNGLTFLRHWNGTPYLSQPLFNGNKATKTFLLGDKAVPLSRVQHMLYADEYAEKPTREDLAEDGKTPFVRVKLENIADAH